MGVFGPYGFTCVPYWHKEYAKTSLKKHAKSGFVKIDDVFVS